MHCKLKTAQITDSDLEILDYSIFSNVETMEVSGNNTWIVEKMRSKAIKKMLIRPDHAQVYLTKLNPNTPRLDFLHI